MSLLVRSTYSSFSNVARKALLLQSNITTSVQYNTLHATSVQQQQQDPSHNDVSDPLNFNPKDRILHNYVNRNPRNMEMMRLARKPKGYDLEAVPPSYWYR